MGWMTGERYRNAPQRLNDTLLTLLTVLISVLLFVVAPLQATGVLIPGYIGFGFGLVLIPAAVMVSGSRIAVGLILVAIVLVFVAAVLDLRESTTIDILFDALAWLIAGLTLSTVVARAVFGQGKVTFHRILGAVLLYLLIGQVFVALFCLVAVFFPNSFNNIGELRGNFPFPDTLIYYSFVTLTTMGYGDIVPVHPFARSLANIEAIVGQLFPATLLARLVTLEIGSRFSA
jgi:hypothetical protein